MEVNEVLQKIGLNEKEAKIYLALLELGNASAYVIAPKAGLKRPITYIVLEQLQQKGLVSIVPKGNKKIYVAEEPSKLVRELGQKQELLKRFLPNLEAIYNVRKEKPQVQLFEGVEGVKMIYQKILDANEALLFGTTKEIAKLDNPWLDSFMKRVKENKFPVKDLLSRDAVNIAYAKNKERGETYQIKFLPNGMNVPADAAIFGDYVALFSFQPQVFSVLLRSKDLAQMFRVWHAMAWKSGEDGSKD